MACYTNGGRPYLISFFVCSLWEILIISGVIYGWAAIVVVFKAEGYFVSLCNPLKLVMNNSHSPSASHINEPRTADIDIGCIEQDERLNLIFTLSVVCLCCVKFPVGIFLDSFGPRLTRLFGCILYTLSAIGLAFTNKGIGNFLFPVFIIMCCGGSLNALSIYQTCNIVYRRTKSLVLCILHGAFDSSAVVLLFFKLGYDGGLSLKAISLFYAALCFLTVTFITLVMIPKYKELCEWNMSMAELQEEANKVLERRAERFLSSSLQSETFIRSESYDNEKKQRIIYKPNANRVSVHRSSFRKYGSFRNSESADGDKEPILRSDAEVSIEPSTLDHPTDYGFPKTIWKSLFSPAYILELLYLSVIQLKLWFYVGSLNSYLMALMNNDEEKVSTYINIFGYVQLCGIFVTPVIGAVFDKGMFTGKSSLPDMPPDKERIYRMRGSILPFFLTSALCTMLCALSLIKHIGVVIPCFFLYTIVRGFLYASHGAYVGIAFSPRFFGRLYGLGVFTGGIFGLLEYVLFIISSNYFGGDPFWMNCFLLVLTCFANTLPMYLMGYCNKASVENILATIEEKESNP